MTLASPTPSAATNHLSIDKILELLKDELWTPGKEAANKHLHNLLGKDPRWLRPKNANEQRKRMAGFKNSERAKKIFKGSRSPISSNYTDQDGIFGPGFPRKDTLDGTTIARSSGSSSGRRELTAQNAAVPVWSDTNYMNLNASQSSLHRFIPLKIRSRQNTSSTNFSVGSSQDEFRAVQAKLPDRPKSDIKDVFRLLKRFTISNDPEHEQSIISPSFSQMHPHDHSMNHLDHQFTPESDEPALGYAMPGDFLGNSPWQQELKRAAAPPTPGNFNLYKRDEFGNTTYHLFAATEGFQEMLLDAIQRGLADETLPMSAKNSGGQTFLHVMHRSWYEGPWLEVLVETLRNCPSFDFYAMDVYGRNFFHLLRKNLDRDSRVNKIAKLFDSNKFNRRDAFGNIPMPRRAGTLPLVKEEGTPRLTIPSGNGHNEDIVKQTQLMKVINRSFRNAAEDNQGRNGLHCLAVVKIDISKIADADSTITVKSRPQKRKLNRNDEPTLQDCSLSDRLGYLRTLLEANVDVNHYDANGNTPLMAFLTHIPDGKEDKDLEQIIQSLLAAGANIEARNRDGETALHVAMRYGQKFALRVLMDQGANPHVRNKDGLGLLKLNGRLQAISEDDIGFCARLYACSSIVHSRFAKDENFEWEPTREQEWAHTQPV